MRITHTHKEIDGWEDPQSDPTMFHTACGLYIQRARYTLGDYGRILAIVHKVARNYTCKNCLRSHRKVAK